MTSELRAALRLVIEAHPTGSSVSLPRELALELLAGEDAPISAPALERDLDCRQLAEFIGRDASTCRAWLARGDFPGAYRFGREWRVPPATIRAWQERQRAGKTAGNTAVTSPRPKSAPLGAWRTVSRETSRS